MKNTLRVDHKNGTIIMDRTFAKLSQNTMSNEYKHLQEVRRDYPAYTVIRKTIRKNTNKESYKGLTYEYMEEYIMTHRTKSQTSVEIMAEYDEMRIISECHSKAFRYPAIKRWFLEKYPEITTLRLAPREEVKDNVSDLPVNKPEDEAKVASF